MRNSGPDSIMMNPDWPQCAQLGYVHTNYSESVWGMHCRIVTRLKRYSYVIFKTLEKINSSQTRTASFTTITPTRDASRGEGTGWLTAEYNRDVCPHVLWRCSTQELKYSCLKCTFIVGNLCVENKKVILKFSRWGYSLDEWKTKQKKTQTQTATPLLSKWSRTIWWNLIIRCSQGVVYKNTQWKETWNPSSLHVYKLSLRQQGKKGAGTVPDHRTAWGRVSSCVTTEVIFWWMV